VRTVAEYSNRNFYGDLRRFTLRGKLGWAFLPSLFAVLRNDRTQVLRSEPIFTLTTEFEQPHLFRPDLTGQISAELDKGVEQAFQYVGGRFRLGVLWQPHPAVSVIPSYNFEADSLQGEALLGGTAPQLAFGCPEPCVISYLEQRVEWDRRNDRLEPTRGYYLALSFQEGGGPLGGAFDYLRIQPEARYYHTFGERLTLAAQLRLGTLIPTRGDDSQSPIIARFYSGGDQMRGFGYHRLSPMFAVRTSNVVDPNNPFAAPIGALPGETVPVGGDGLFDGSVELRYALTENLVLAVFLDTGFVTREHFQFGNPSYFTDNLQYALGIGLRYRTVVGPIRVDFARRLNIGPPLVVQQLPGQSISYPVDSGCFGLGNSGRSFAGAPDGLCNLQISIGEAF
jgi:translocation and assembly module TamA